MEKFITINQQNINDEHICCAFSDKKCKDGYELKKRWLHEELSNGYVFRKLNARAKVFMEYGPAEKGWMPIDAPGYLLIGCFWVSGQYKGKGYAKELLRLAIEDATDQEKSGLVTVTGSSKMHFMSDPKWLIQQGFEICDRLPNGFVMLVKRFDIKTPFPKFKNSVLSGECSEKNGLVVYYSNRCPFSEYHVNVSLKESAFKRNIPLKIIKINTLEEAQSSPTPATIFSLFFNGKFITTDISVCMDSRFDKITGKCKP